MSLRGWLAAGVLATSAVLSFGVSPECAAAAARPAPALLDVPYVPQSEELCGGAALAMVLRFWGEPGVLAEDFGSLVDSGQAGIRAEDLAGAVVARGWSAFPVTGTAADVQGHLAAGRPVIALIRVSPSAFHYVVIVAWANGGVLVHDPAVGPFRFRREADFDAAWSASERWALLVLPPARTPVDATPVAPESLSASAAPDSAATPLELASLRFRARDWPGAARFAEQAAKLDPGDVRAWRLLAGSRWLAGDVLGALDAWNRVGEPRADLTHIDGLDRVRYRIVERQVDLPPGRLITARAFVRAQRRLAELPAGEQSRLGLEPRGDGTAQVSVAFLERPLLFGGRWDAAATGVRAIVAREIALHLASPTGQGELWSAAVRAAHERPRVALALALPGAPGPPGTWRAEGSWERQAYAAPVLSRAGSDVIREERRRAALSWADWVGADQRLELGAAYDRWVDRGAHVSLGGKLETRLLADRLALGAEGAAWTSLAGGPPFHSGGLLARWSSPDSGHAAWRARAGITGVSAAAPAALWPGAGTGGGRPFLLRAHPLLDEGIVSGPAFGRTLVHGGIERRGPLWRAAPLRLGWAVFVDAARAHAPTQVDAGLGLRVGGLGRRGELRVDVAHGMADGRTAVSIGWEAR